MTRLLTRLAVVSLVMAASTSAGASGSGSPGGSPSSSGDRSLYNAGKAVFARKLACSACPYAGQRASAELARQVLADSATLATLAPQELEALETYFSERWGVEN